MGFDAELPTIEEQLANSSFTKTSQTLDELTNHNFTLAYMPDPPTVEVKQGHLIEAINKLELDSILLEINKETDTVLLFYITDEETIAYQSNYNDGVRSLVSLLLAEDWFVIEMDATAIPPSVADYCEEQTVLTDGYADEGELFSETYAANQLKNRIYDLKQTDSDLFVNPQEHINNEEESKKN
jgi:hypothetical protein